VRAIDATSSAAAGGLRRPTLLKPRALLIGVALSALALGYFTLPAGAHAGQSSTGELAFYPCTQCHPVRLDASGKPTKPLPVGMEKHEIVLEVHDILGEGDEACLACHDDPTRNPGKLILADGSFVDITGDVSRVCQRCHFEKYQQWTTGVHGKHEPKCSAAGCHDPHTPSWIYVAALPPFQGTGIEVNAVGDDREPFKPFAGPPVAPGVVTPSWLVAVTFLGLLVSVGIVGFLVVGRPKR